jgi:SAM-dependent methyltransferase
MTVLAAQPWRTNAELIADCARLGYLQTHWRTLDPTFGRGGFWKKWRPAELVVHDMKLDGVDFTDLPHGDASFDAVVFDPPYKLNGTPTRSVDERYGVDVVDTREARHDLIRAGIDECARVLRPGGWLLVKCQDQVNGGKVRWQTREFADHAELKHGMRLVDMLHRLGYRPQPAGRRQVHARRNYSTLLVFQAGKGEV